MPIFYWLNQVAPKSVKEFSLFPDWAFLLRRFMVDGTKEFLNKLNKKEKQFIKEIIKTPYLQLLKEIKEQDYQHKKELIAQIETFKTIYKKTKDIKTKEIVNSLTKELEEVNGLIDRLKKVVK